MFSLESPLQGDSNEYAQHAIINIKKKITLNYPKYNNVCSYGIFSWGLKDEFETAMVNEPSVFEPLKVYCRYSKMDLCYLLIKFLHHKIKVRYPKKKIRKIWISINTLNISYTSLSQKNFFLFYYFFFTQ